jgi:hypothetical protein
MRLDFSDLISVPAFRHISYLQVRFRLLIQRFSGGAKPVATGTASQARAAAINERELNGALPAYKGRQDTLRVLQFILVDGVWQARIPL